MRAAVMLVQNNRFLPNPQTLESNAYLRDPACGVPFDIRFEIEDKEGTSLGIVGGHKTKTNKTILSSVIDLYGQPGFLSPGGRQRDLDREA